MLSALSAWAQTSSGSTSSGSTPSGSTPTSAEANQSSLPEPYSADEFPSWAVGLRRFEIVSLGAFPLILFYTNFVFDISRFVEKGFAADYVPWPFKNESSYKLSNEEQIQSVAVAAVVSLVFGALDSFLMWRLSIE